MALLIATDVLMSAVALVGPLFQVVVTVSVPLPVLMGVLLRFHPIRLTVSAAPLTV